MIEDETISLVAHRVVVDDLKKRLDLATAEVARLRSADEGTWRAAVEDQMVVHWVPWDGLTPREAVSKLLDVSQSWALDPRVSREARDLIELGRREVRRCRRCGSIRPGKRDEEE